MLLNYLLIFKKYISDWNNINISYVNMNNNLKGMLLATALAAISFTVYYATFPVFAELPHR